MPCSSPLLKSSVKPPRILLESNDTQVFPLHTLNSSSLAPVMVLQAAFEVKEQVVAGDVEIQDFQW